MAQAKNRANQSVRTTQQYLAKLRRLARKNKRTMGGQFEALIDEALERMNHDAR